MIRVFHCDDSSAFRLLVREMFSGNERIQLVGEAENPQAAAEGVREVQPDVILLDMLDPDRPHELIGEMRAAAPGARIVVYSGYPADTAHVAHGGAEGYVEKSAPFEQVEQTIVDVASG